MTTIEDWRRATADVNLAVMGAVGAGPPLKYLWMPFAFVAVVAVALWTI